MASTPTCIGCSPLSQCFFFLFGLNAAFSYITDTISPGGWMERLRCPDSSSGATVGLQTRRSAFRSDRGHSIHWDAVATFPSVVEPTAGDNTAQFITERHRCSFSRPRTSTPVFLLLAFCCHWLFRVTWHGPANQRSVRWNNVDDAPHLTSRRRRDPKERSWLTWNKIE